MTMPEGNLDLRLNYIKHALVNCIWAMHDLYGMLACQSTPEGKALIFGDPIKRLYLYAHYVFVIELTKLLEGPLTYGRGKIASKPNLALRNIASIAEFIKQMRIHSGHNELLDKAERIYSDLKKNDMMIIFRELRDGHFAHIDGQGNLPGLKVHFDFPILGYLADSIDSLQHIYNILKEALTGDQEYEAFTTLERNKMEAFIKDHLKHEIYYLSKFPDAGFEDGYQENK